MQSGQLDTLFEVYQQSSEKNTAGQKKDVWTVIGSFYGGVEPISTQTFVQSGLQGSALVCRVVMRPDDYPGLNAALIIKDVDRGEIYKISGVLPINKGKQSLLCTIGKLL